MESIKVKTSGGVVHLVTGCLKDENTWNWCDKPMEKPNYGQVWAVNGLWTLVPWVDVGFEMHDLGGPSYEAMGDRADAYVDNGLLESKTKIYMPSYPQEEHVTTKDRYWKYFNNIRRYPIEAVENHFGLVNGPYWAESSNYMIALAVMWGVRELHLHEYWFPPEYDRPGERASIEFWLGVAHARGVRIVMDDTCNILQPDQWEDFYQKHRYGYRR